MKTILIFVKDDVNVSRLMTDIYRKYEGKIAAITNNADVTEERILRVVNIEIPKDYLDKSAFSAVEQRQQGTAIARLFKRAYRSILGGKDDA